MHLWALHNVICGAVGAELTVFPVTEYNKDSIFAAASKRLIHRCDLHQLLPFANVQPLKADMFYLFCQTSVYLSVVLVMKLLRTDVGIYLRRATTKRYFEFGPANSSAKTFRETGVALYLVIYLGDGAIMQKANIYFTRKLARK